MSGNAPSLSKIREAVTGDLPIEALSDPTNENYTITAADEQLIAECISEFGEALIAAEIIQESIQGSDEIIMEALTGLHSYLVGQSMISESAAMPSFHNPKVSFVRLNKDATIKRLASIIEIKLARKQKTRGFKQYKIGTKLKKLGRFDMHRQFGPKASNLAKKAYPMLMKNHSKVQVTVDNAVKKIKAK